MTEKPLLIEVGELTFKSQMNDYIKRGTNLHLDICEERNII